MPDENIWHDPDALAEHFEAVKLRREAGMEAVDDSPDPDQKPLRRNRLLDQYLED